MDTKQISIIGKTAISKYTGKTRTITSIKRNKAFVSFEYGGEIAIPINKLENTLMLDQETRNTISCLLRSSLRISREGIRLFNI